MSDVDIAEFLEMCDRIAAVIAWPVAIFVLVATLVVIVLQTYTLYQIYFRRKEG